LHRDRGVQLRSQGSKSAAGLASDISALARGPLDFEATIGKTLLDLRRRLYIREVKFDPYQLISTAQRLTAQGVPMVEFPRRACRI
jgi:hypothetical protein